jgi:dynein regulatory complex protein 1
MEWKPPIEDLFKNVDPLFFQKKNNHKTKISDAEQALENQIEERIEPNYQDQIKESLASKFQSSKKNSKTMKMTLELLCNEAGFLVEDKLQKLLEPLQRDEQSLMRLDSIFKALGVESVVDIERLSSFFVQDAISDQDSQKSKSELIIEDNAVLIHPNDVVTAIRRFVDSSRHSNFEKEDTTEMEEQFKGKNPFYGRTSNNTH